MDVILQSRTPEHGLGLHHPETAAGHGRAGLLLTAKKNGGITRAPGRKLQSGSGATLRSGRCPTARDTAQYAETAEKKPCGCGQRNDRRSDVENSRVHRKVS